MARIKKVSEKDLYKMLCEGKVKFQFEKKDGTIREAVGTLNPGMITKIPAGGANYPKMCGYTTYFDLDKNNFRCFLGSKLIGVVED